MIRGLPKDTRFFCASRGRAMSFEELCFAFEYEIKIGYMDDFRKRLHRALESAYIQGVGAGAVAVRYEEKPKAKKKSGKK